MGFSTDLAAAYWLSYYLSELIHVILSQ